jgi:tight adherence protein C
VNIDAWLGTTSLLWSPLTAAALMGLAILMIWAAFAPARPAAAVKGRLDGYLDRKDVSLDPDMRKPFVARVFGPLLRQVLRLLGSLAPKRNVQATELLLRQAGEPWGLSALDFFGLRLLSVLVAGGVYFLIARGTVPFSTLLRNSAILGAVGFFIPWLWLRSRARNRMNEISRALPDALDMLTIGVEAGLAFESALLRVGDRWRNALTREFQRAVAEMRVGTPRDQALARMADRTGVPELRAFVTVLIQSSQLGVSIAEVLRTQAAEMRIKRRQRAEEAARQAGVKMVFPLVFLIFPPLFVVVLGPSIPAILMLLQNMSGGK